jgi:hypothetical protein
VPLLNRLPSCLYQVEVKTLNRAVKRNIKRFPTDFMFQLTKEEWNNLKCKNDNSSLRYQIGTAKMVGKARYNPYVFTEQGISMIIYTGLLNSDLAISINIQIMRAFVQLRHMALSQTEINEQITELRKILMLQIENNNFKFSEHDKAINQIIMALNNLIEKPPKTKTIGFRAGG